MAEQPTTTAPEEPKPAPTDTPEPTEEPVDPAPAQPRPKTAQDRNKNVETLVKALNGEDGMELYSPGLLEGSDPVLNAEIRQIIVDDPEAALAEVFVDPQGKLSVMSSGGSSVKTTPLMHAYKGENGTVFCLAVASSLQKEGARDYHNQGGQFNFGQNEKTQYLKVFAEGAVSGGIMDPSYPELLKAGQALGVIDETTEIPVLGTDGKPQTDENGEPQTVALHVALQDKAGSLMDGKDKAIADQSVKIVRNSSTIHTAVKDGNNEQLRKLVEDTDLCVDARDKNGQTPLELAVAAGNEEAVKILLEGKVDSNGEVKGQADINVRTKDGKSMVDIALDNGQDKVFDLLVDSPSLDDDIIDAAIKRLETEVATTSDSDRQAALTRKIEKLKEARIIPDLGDDSTEKAGAGVDDTAGRSGIGRGGAGRGGSGRGRGGGSGRGRGGGSGRPSPAAAELPEGADPETGEITVEDAFFSADGKYSLTIEELKEGPGFWAKWAPSWLGGWPSEKLDLYNERKGPEKPSIFNWFIGSYGEKMEQYKKERVAYLVAHPEWATKDDEQDGLLKVALSILDGQPSAGVATRSTGGNPGAGKQKEGGRFGPGSSKVSDRPEGEVKMTRQGKPRSG